jgi:hypothetical protein
MLDAKCWKQQNLTEYDKTYIEIMVKLLTFCKTEKKEEGKTPVFSVQD